MAILLATALGWRAWTACGITLFGWTPYDRCGTVSQMAEDALSTLAATPLLQAERQQAGLALEAGQNQCVAPELPIMPTGLADLAGCWRYIGPGETVTDAQDGWEICLTANGTGEQRVDLPGGVICQGPVSVNWTDPAVAVLSSVGDTPCDDGSDLFQVIQRCQWTNSVIADCLGAQPAQEISDIPGRLVPVEGAL